MRRDELQILAGFGIVIPPQAEYVEDAWKGNYGLAMDAQPSLVTVSNAGIPGYLTNLLDPEVVRILTSPMKAATIFDETKKGDWTTLSTQFPVVESTGEVSSYGDHNNNGSSGANVNWVPRQSYHFQTISQWGERELDMYGLAKINYASEINVGSALVISKFLNLSYFYGITGLQNYGALNDPSLIAPITPAVKAAGGVTWAVATAPEVYADVLALFSQLQTQMGGLTEMDADMTLALSPTLAVNLNKLSPFNVSVRQMLKENFPALKIETAPEYATTGGQLMQLILNVVDGTKTAYVGFTEKMRAHPVIPDLSSWKQKKSAGTWGFINRRPIAIAQMLGM